ncbi:MAG TPA: amidohydrolase family protein [Terriglobales bacterium]|nr:amidohydrolase family protein [Terriglobales bacterium]
MLNRRAGLGWLCAFVLSLLWAAPIGAQAPIAVRAGDTVVRGGSWIDVERGVAVRNTAMIVRDGVIMAIGADVAGADLSAAHVMNLSADEYILPGIFDLHAHYAVDLFGAGRIDEYHVNPVLYLANGVTSTFPAGEVDPAGMKHARELIDAGQQVGPRIYNSGPYFGSARPGWNNALETPERIRAEVDYWAANGVRDFKGKGIHPEQLQALIDEAHKHGLTVTGHLDSGFRDSVNPRDAILMGIDRIEHFMGGDTMPATRSAYASLQEMDVNSPDELAEMKLFIRQHVFYDATLSTYGNYNYGHKDPKVFAPWTDEEQFLTPYARTVVTEGLKTKKPNEQFNKIYLVKRKEIKRFYDVGGRDWITLGTDLPSWGEDLDGFADHRELRAFVAAGIPPKDALRFATINGARALNVANKLGSIDVGKYADLFVVRGNPLADIENAHKVQWVMKSGQVYDTAELLASVAGTMGPAGPEDADAWKGRMHVTEPVAQPPDSLPSIPLGVAPARGGRGRGAGGRGGTGVKP